MHSLHDVRAALEHVWPGKEGKGKEGKGRLVATSNSIGESQVDSMSCVFCYSITGKHLSHKFFPNLRWIGVAVTHMTVAMCHVD